jgi:hypothetical protein
MLLSSDDLLSIWIVLLVLSLGETTRRTIQILSKSLLQCNILTKGENKKNNPDTKQIITTVQHTNYGREQEEQSRYYANHHYCATYLLSIWIVLFVLSPSLYVAL